MKENGNWEPIDECRDAWKKRVTLPHAEFEILLKRHMRGGMPNFATLDADERAARASVAAVRASVTALLAAPARHNAFDLALFFKPDGLFGTDIRNGLCNNGRPPSAARAAWAIQSAIAGLYDNMPGNFWCSSDALRDGFITALEDVREPACHGWTSDLCAIHRLQTAQRILPNIAAGLRRAGHGEHENVARLCAHLYAFAGATMRATVNDAAAEYAAQVARPGVTPLRRPSGPV
jgi:hypothetical protein